jgi:hypothetical protein
MMSPYDTIKRLVESIILPKYPELKLHDIDSYPLNSRREYDVRFKVKEKLPSETQVKINEDVKSLFRMASLDELETNKRKRNTIKVWFKTPNSKDWSFSSPLGYEH